MEGADFGCWATKANLLCTDGVTISPGAFKGQDGDSIPVVYQHNHDSIDKVLGHAILEERDEGTYAWVFFNDNPDAKKAKHAVLHKDITRVSIWANKLVKSGQNVVHGAIRELSLVLAGANPGAVIDNIMIRHSEFDVETVEGDAIITTGETLEILHSDGGNKLIDKDSESDIKKSYQDVIDTMTEEQQDVFYSVVGQLVDEVEDKSSNEEDDDEKDDEAKHGDTDLDDADDKSDDDKSDKDNNTDDNDGQKGDDNMKTEDKLQHSNVFEDKSKSETSSKYVLTHADKQGIFADAMKAGSMSDAVDSFCVSHGIDRVDILFPDAKTVDGNIPQFLKRRTEWVDKFMSQTTKTPFSRIKNVWADITEDEARAKGYITGTLKKDEFFQIAKRVTVPTTVYKKQKLDRDDIVDISDFDVVAWLKMEMRVMLDEEIARAGLIGDGRDVASADKINEQNIRPIATEHELFCVTVNVSDPSVSEAATKELIDDVVRARAKYRGTGQPTMYTSESVIASFLLLKDTLGRDLYPSIEALALKLRVREIVPVEVMETVPDIIAIIVNPVDYTYGANKGGEVNLFDQFDIDYNQEKYLIETRCSGALTKLKSALVLRSRPATNTLIVPSIPTFNSATNTVTIPTDANVAYFNKDTEAALADGSTHVLDDGEVLRVVAVAAATYYFATSDDDEWSFRGQA